ncbi:hypothetical protein J2T20_004035 [Paenibacillus wynnii]|nr:hypothetical protein [Paenibacillus wynnii]
MKKSLQRAEVTLLVRSVAKGSGSTWALGYLPRNSHRAAPNPYLLELEPTEYRGSWGDKKLE